VDSRQWSNMVASIAAERNTQCSSARIWLRFKNSELRASHASDTLWSLHESYICSKFVSTKDKGKPSINFFRVA
jgi:hypothetical protein